MTDDGGAGCWAPEPTARPWPPRRSACGLLLHRCGGIGRSACWRASVPGWRFTLVREPRGRGQAVSGAEDRSAAERAKLGEAMVVTAAESTATSARMTELVEAQRAARARWSAAKGLVTKALRDGNAAKIAAARQRAAYAEFDRIGRAAVEEMLALNRRGLGNLGLVLDQMGRAWDADAEVTRNMAADPLRRSPGNEQHLSGWPASRRCCPAHRLAAELLTVNGVAGSQKGICLGQRFSGSWCVFVCEGQVTPV
jgi:hypothetical protein